MVNIDPEQLGALDSGAGVGHQVGLCAHQPFHPLDGAARSDSADIGDVSGAGQPGHRADMESLDSGEVRRQPVLGGCLQRQVVHAVAVRGLYGKNKRRYALGDKALDNAANLIDRQQVAVAVAPGIRPPDHYAVFIDMGQLELAALQQGAGGVQGPAGSHGVSDTPVGQAAQGVAGAVGKCRIAVQQGAVEVENYQLHMRGPESCEG